MTETTDSLTPVEDLLARARAYVTHSHAKNILDAYAADWKHFSAWCDYHKRARHGLPTKDPEVERTMRGIRRAKGVAPNGKAPILTPLLCRIVAALPDDLSGLRDKAMLLIGFA